jgi:hypothetical protein
LRARTPWAGPSGEGVEGPRGKNQARQGVPLPGLDLLVQLVGGAKPGPLGPTSRRPARKPTKLAMFPPLTMRPPHPGGYPIGSGVIQ